MPRLYTSAGEPLDFCRDHFPTEDEAILEYGNEEVTGTGPDGRGNCFSYDDDHPDYFGDSMYRCTICKSPLGHED
jgi:hypothetical protein